MKVPVNVRFDVIQGHGAGQLMGRVVFENDQGEVVEEGEPLLLAAGKSLNVTGVHAAYELQGQLPTELTATPERKNGGDTGAKGQAKGQPVVPGRR